MTRMTIKEWCEYIRKYREDKGFFTPSSINLEAAPVKPTFGDLLLSDLMQAIIPPVCEAAEAARHNDYGTMEACLFEVANSVGVPVIVEKSKSDSPLPVIEVEYQFSAERAEKEDFDRESLTNSEFAAAKLLLVITELSEAAEAIESQDVDNFKEELADAVIRIMDICGTMGIDLEEEIDKKMQVNLQRPILHGKQTNA